MLTCHVLFTEIDDEHPATLSPRDRPGDAEGRARLPRRGDHRRSRHEGDRQPLHDRGDGGALPARRLRRLPDLQRRLRQEGAGARGRHPRSRGRHGVRQARRGRDDADAPAEGALPGRAPADARTRTGWPRWRRSSTRWWPRRCGSGCEAGRDRTRPGRRRAVWPQASAAPCGRAIAWPSWRRPARAPKRRSAAAPSSSRRSASRSPIDERVFAQAGGYLAGEPALRAAHLQEAFADPSVAGIVCVRGGYGSAQILPLLDAEAIAATPKVFVGYSDITAVHTWLQQQAGLVTFHGPMLEGRFADRARYDRDSFVRAVCGTEPMGAIVPPGARDLARRRGLRRARRRHHHPARGVARHALRLRSAARLRAVLRRGERAAVPAGSAADAAGAGRHHRPRQRHRLQRAARLRRAGRPGARRRRGPPRPRRVRRADRRRLPVGPHARRDHHAAVRRAGDGRRHAAAPRSSSRSPPSRADTHRSTAQAATAQGDSQRCRIAFTSSGSAARRWPPSPRCSRRAAGTCAARTNRSIRR